MRTILCLGLHRTGSTSLQRFLLANQVVLARAGTLYPPVHPEGVARLLAALLGRLDPAESAPRLNEYMGHNALAYRLIADAVTGFVFPPVHAPMPPGEEVLDHAADMARRMRAKRLIFCSEDLARAGLMAPDVPAAFARRFGEGGMALFAVIRRPDAALSSWQCQRLMFGDTFRPIPETGIADWLGSVHVAYRAALAPWIAQVPETGRHLLPYTETRDAGGTVAAFRQRFAAALPPGLAEVPDDNASVPHALMEIARRGLGALPRGPAAVLRGYLLAAGARLRLPPNAEVDLLGPQARADLAQAFVPVHDWLCRVTGRDRFFPDLAKITRRPRFDAREAAVLALPALLADAERHLVDPAAAAFLGQLARDGL